MSFKNFPALCSMHLNFSLSSKQGEMSQFRETFSPKWSPRLSPELMVSHNENWFIRHKKLYLQSVFSFKH